MIFKGRKSDLIKLYFIFSIRQFHLNNTKLVSQ